MRTSKSRHVRALMAVVASAVVLAGCSAGDLGSSDKGSDGGGKVTLSFLVDNSDNSVKVGEGLAKAFTAANPDITVKVESRPAGADGDNLVKTRLATGDMSDVFMYNSGSLFQAINPKTNLVPLTGQYLDNIVPSFFDTVSVGSTKYGVPFGTAMGGGVLYNKPIFDKLGLSVPKTWAEFMANNKKIKASGVPPVIQGYQTDTWTSQLFMLGDFHNVAAAEPDFAAQYTAGKKKYATDPAALKSFERLQQVRDAGYMNKDFASTNLNEALKKVATGEGAQYPALTFTVSTIQANTPNDVKNVGFFALPGDDAATNGLTTWYPAGVYIPTSTKDAKLAAAKKFLGFIASPAGCEAQTAAVTPQGPYLVKDCPLPKDLPPATLDLLPYFEKAGAASPALEFLSPIKGPSLEQILIEVGQGSRSAVSAAGLYDQDVKKQAQQLGLPGWN